ncbi:glycosyltransferase [Gordonia sp. 852002-10350_SCH5691597]|uniref:glycosyltransferase n=1 Tax=Gordonia sp. 852002-10350_SCH5691597 TaxID=1834085 RepID=UPI0007EA5F1B|nr:glycosyltransferase [Gordonia sp. 852002-10350_SCH5691597]OBA73831.1 glycosyl transferase family 1 [Gordonia sp. 852002-10350_SCH5691597]
MTSHTTGRQLIHVTESFASGTAAAIGDYVRNYPDVEHHLVYATRAEATVDVESLGQFASTIELPEGTANRIRFLNGTVRDKGPAVIHAHSSKAGVYVRLALRNSQRTPIVYTPHCYAFERRDVPGVIRTGFRFAEWLLSFNTSAIGACSPRERELSEWPVSNPRTVLVPNVTPSHIPQHQRTASTRLRIAGNGRLGPQKDAHFFAECVASARRSGTDFEAVWIGGGDEESARLLRSAGVDVTGWLSREQALKTLAAADVYLHTAQWEGFPISILEAATAGLPVIARAQPYVHGFRMPMTIDHPSQLEPLLKALADPETYAATTESTQRVLADNTDDAQRAALGRLYDRFFQKVI